MNLLKGTVLAAAILAGMALAETALAGKALAEDATVRGFDESFFLFYIIISILFSIIAKFCSGALDQCTFLR